MTLFSARQVVPVDYEVDVSRRLLGAVCSGDSASFFDCVSSRFVDVNYVGAVTIKSRTCDVVLRGELPNEICAEYQELKVDVTPLFLAVHSGNVALVRKLLSVGADVNQKLFRGYATTAAAREGHLEILKILLKAGASQPACEEALLEACCHGWPSLVEVLIGTDLIRPNIAGHALSASSCRGFVDVVDALMKCGVDINAKDRMLLQSSNPSLHRNIDCTPLVAAIVSRQLPIVSLLLKAGARTDIQVKIGAWSWDVVTGEEIRVGAGLGEPYDITWCAVEYFEETGAILRLLLHRFRVNAPYCGRTLLHHAILCGNAGAVKVLLSCGADAELPVKAAKSEFRPLHMAARLGLPEIVQLLVGSGCELNSVTDSGDTALMMCCRNRNKDCLKVLSRAGADFGLLDETGMSAWSLAESNDWSLEFQHCLLDVIKGGVTPSSSNTFVFDPLTFVARTGDAAALEALIKSSGIHLDRQDGSGFSAVMYTALYGYVEAFRLLVYAGANVKISNKEGENAISLSEVNDKRYQFEKVMLEFALEKGFRNAEEFRALHYASRRGDLVAVKLLLNWGYDVNVPDSYGYTPLMLAAREGHGSMCEALISAGARCEYANSRGDTALTLARIYSADNTDAENVILDALARNKVLGGARVLKHTKNGKGKPHVKEIIVTGAGGVFRWGKSEKRNVVCVDAAVGPSPAFRRNRQKKGPDDSDSPGLFHVVTTKKKEYHFVCEGGAEVSELWVRGVKILTSC